jgi:hypothetical protein
MITTGLNFMNCFFHFTNDESGYIKANVRVYDHLRVPCHFCIEIQLLLKISKGQLYSLKTKLYMLAQAYTAIGYTCCWSEFLFLDVLTNCIRLNTPLFIRCSSSMS